MLKYNWTNGSVVISVLKRIPVVVWGTICWCLFLSFFVITVDKALAMKLQYTAWIWSVVLYVCVSSRVWPNQIGAVSELYYSLLVLLLLVRFKGVPLDAAFCMCACTTTETRVFVCMLLCFLFLSRLTINVRIHLALLRPQKACAVSKMPCIPTGRT